MLAGYQGGLAEQPYVLGNMFHANNKQNAKYSPDSNLMKGIQTAGGNKFVMQDKQGEQSINISNSNNKGTSLNINFNGDGSVSISTNGPINLTAGGDITLTAGNNITITAKKNVIVTAQEEAVALDAKMALDMVAEDLTADFRNNLTINASVQAKIKSQDTDII